MNLKKENKIKSKRSQTKKSPYLDKDFTTVFVIVLTICFTLLIFFIEPNIVGNVINEMSMTIANSPPIINLTDFTAYVGDTINLTECGYDLNGDVVFCSYSAPIPANNIWNVLVGDVGTHNITINATDERNWTIKYITVIVQLLGEEACNLNATLNEDNKTVKLEWNLSGQGYKNYTLFMYDDYLENATFDFTNTSNISFYEQTKWNDTTAGNVKQRYYKIKAFNEFNSKTCNVTVGKFDWELTTANGRWNYVSLPFEIKNSFIEDVFAPIKSSIDWVYTFNHTSGDFNLFYFMPFSTGPYKYLKPGECILVKPNADVNLTIVGEIYTKIEINLTIANGRWNYFGWVAEKTPRAEAEIPILAKYDWLYSYNESSGTFNDEFWFNTFGIGKLYDFKAGDGYIIKATDTGIWVYDMYNFTN